MNPIDFVDDVVCAVSFYVTEGLEAIASKLTEVRISRNHVHKFVTTITSAMQKSVDKNSDLMELYVMRNIFHIDTDVDLAGALSSPMRSPRKEMIPDVSDDLDVRLTNLYEEIEAEERKKMRLVAAIKREEEQLKITEMIDARLPEIRELAKAAKALPHADVNAMLGDLTEILVKARTRPRSDPAKALAAYQDGFKFD